MKHQKINHLAVWLCVVACQLLSVIWYSPALFANRWMQLLGKTFADFDGESLNGLFFSITGAIILSYFLAWLYIRLQVNNGAKGLLIALVVAVCCFVFTTFTQDGFSQRPVALSLINTGSVVLNFSIAGLILGGWPKYRLN